jgi:outer membrane immunogenic protein
MSNALPSDQIGEIATSAYMYAYPLIMMEITRRVSTNVADTSHFGKPPMNQFGHLPAFPDATFTDVVRPNADTLWDRVLFYGTGGIAFADVTNDYGESFPCFQGGPIPGMVPGCFVGLTFDSRTRTLVGWTAGGGIEYAVTPNWLIGVEYRYTDFGRFTDTGLLGNTNPGVSFGSEADAHHHLTQNRVQARVSYKFDWLAPSPVIAKY